MARTDFGSSHEPRKDPASQHLNRSHFNEQDDEFERTQGHSHESVEEELADLREKYAYLLSEFDGFRRRSLNEQSQTRRFGAEGLARDLLEVVDNLERSLKYLDPETDPGLSDGVKLTLNQFKAVLGRHGIERVRAEGEEFDPNFHQAVAQVESDQPAGTVVKEERTGYRLHDRLLRPAQVVVSSGEKPHRKGEQDFQEPGIHSRRHRRH